MTEELQPPLALLYALHGKILVHVKAILGQFHCRVVQRPTITDIGLLGESPVLAILESSGSQVSGLMYACPNSRVIVLVKKRRWCSTAYGRRQYVLRDPFDTAGFARACEKAGLKKTAGVIHRSPATIRELLDDVRTAAQAMLRDTDAYKSTRWRMLQAMADSKDATDALNSSVANYEAAFNRALTEFPDRAALIAAVNS